LGQVKDI